jgi:hypothetical protein
MKTMMLKNWVFGFIIVVCFVSVFGGEAKAWEYSISTIKKNIQYNSESDLMMIELDSGLTCHFDKTTANGKSLASSALAAFLSGTTVAIHCDEAETTLAGYTTHRIHRFILTK